MKQLTYISILLILTLCLLSCNRIKDGTKRVADKIKTKTKEELKKQTQNIVDKVFPPFDHDKPDTENNKLRFSDFIKIEISSDVKNIYCYDNTIGIDASYMFSFNCDHTTSKRIIEVHNLNVDTLNSDNGFALQNDFMWWNKKRIDKLQKYSWSNENKYYKFYWYDKEEEKAYFFEFDM